MSGISNECWVARCSTIVFPPSLFFQFFNNFPPVHTVLNNLFSLLLFLFSIPFLSIFFISFSHVEVCSSFFCLASPCRYPPVLSIERFGVKIFTRARVRFFRFFSQFRGIVRTGVYLPLRAVFFFLFFSFFMHARLFVRSAKIRGYTRRSRYHGMIESRSSVKDTSIIAVERWSLWRGRIVSSFFFYLSSWISNETML